MDEILKAKNGKTTDSRANASEPDLVEGPSVPAPGPNIKGQCNLPEVSGRGPDPDSEPFRSPRLST